MITFALYVLYWINEFGKQHICNSTKNFDEYLIFKKTKLMSSCMFQRSCATVAFLSVHCDPLKTLSTSCFPFLLCCPFPSLTLPAFQWRCTSAAINTQISTSMFLMQKKKNQCNKRMFWKQASLSVNYKLHYHKILTNRNYISLTESTIWLQ